MTERNIFRAFVGQISNPKHRSNEIMQEVDIMLILYKTLYTLYKQYIIKTIYNNLP